jgi:hypothetical protein
MADAIENSDYLDEWLETNPGPPFYTEEELAASEDAIRNVDEGFVEWIQQFLTEEYPNEYG